MVDRSTGLAVSPWGFLMSIDVSAPAHLVVSTRRRRPWWPWLVLAMPVVFASFWLAGTRARRARLFSGTPVALSTVAVDRGDLFTEVVEYGTLESANNATVKCQVEAVIGLVGGAQAGTGAGGRGGGSRGQGGQGGQGSNSGGAGGGAGAGAGGAAPAEPVQTKKGAAGKTKAGQGGAGGASKKTSGASGSNAGTAGAAGAAVPGGQASGSSGGQGAGGQGKVKAPSRPTIRSFSYVVPPHITAKAKSSTGGQMQSQGAGSASGGSRGGRSGGGSGGRGGGGDMEEKPGSTRIISILPEGTQVKPGDVVCVLDSAAFRDEYQAQQIRETQAKVLVEQAEVILEVNQITLREFRDGIRPQDALLIRQYISTCKIQEEQARSNVEWSREAHRKRYRATAQLNADLLAWQQAQIALREAEGMARRLDKYTAPRVLKALEAKIAAIRADKSARESSYELERARLKKLGDMIAFCTLKAPGEGIVVYAKESSSWGRTTAQIEQGVTVRQGQAIFHLPDPKKMHVKTRINESKYSMVREGQRAEILIDAFPDQPLRGTVRQVTAIPSPLNGPFSDVRAYNAMVEIDEGGLEGLRPGLSAQVSFEVEERRQVTRVPLQAIRRVGDATFAALRTSADSADSPWVWQKISIGLIDPTYAEVIDGLKPGDRVVERPDALPAPPAVSNVANAGRAARG